MNWRFVPFLLVAVGIPLVALGWCTWRFLARPRAEGFSGRLVQAFGLLGLAALGASVVQLVVSSLGWNWSGHGFDALGLLAMLPISWLVLCGGWSVQWVFEETAKELTGHRQSTLADNWHYYLALTVVQLLLLSVLVAWEGKAPEKRAPLAWAAAAAVALNGIAGMAWPWWGT